MNQTKLPAFIERELVSMISNIGVVFDEKIPELESESGNSSLSLLVCELAEFGHYHYEEQKRFMSSLDSLFDNLLEQ